MPFDRMKTGFDYMEDELPETQRFLYNFAFGNAKVGYFFIFENSKKFRSTNEDSPFRPSTSESSITSRALRQIELERA